MLRAGALGWAFVTNTSGDLEAGESPRIRIQFSNMGSVHPFLHPCDMPTIQLDSQSINKHWGAENMGHNISLLLQLNPSEKARPEELTGDLLYPKWGPGG